jgi:hypothetical protein
MSTLRSFVSIVFAAAIGVTHGVALALVLALLASKFSVAGWLYSLGVSNPALWLILLLIDFTFQTALSLPAAALLRLLRPLPYPWYVFIALLALLAWIYIPVVNALTKTPISWYSLWAVASQVIPLPIAGWLIACSGMPPNNSFKPNPLRGSA